MAIQIAYVCPVSISLSPAWLRPWLTPWISSFKLPLDYLVSSASSLLSPIYIPRTRWVLSGFGPYELAFGVREDEHTAMTR